ncbi:MAG: Holliday junction resolvase RuvX [Hydrogenophaga sp.]|uniref:Holliday junction resolvase RuvX n=1 Tax=Hydrogenophaga sp. TaxID=1904254 RepID=UPI00262F3249|nr:Holliday junction resolvase RuvX [Hydrogenophaga sp.]MDD3786726.1 Holliday junction resolvase RuvX [Hydrogenophaga sp.]
MTDSVLLGFDYGTKRIGVAVGQTLTGSARPLTIVRARDGKPDWEAISRLISEWQPAALVIGLPVHMDGTEHERTTRAQRFGNQLAGRYNLPVHRVDERLTSYEAELDLRAQGKGGEALDAVAAQLILQSWLDAHVKESRP